MTQPHTSSGSGVISKKELKLFYTAFLDAGKLDDSAVAELTDKSYGAMTSNGEVQLSFHMYKLSFLNFLLGKQPNGPGQWLFGQVEREVSGQEQFLIDFTLWSREEEVVKPIAEVKQKDKKTDLVEDTLPTKLICMNEREKANGEVEKTLRAAERNDDKEEGFKSREGNMEHGDLEGEVNQANNVDNTGTPNKKAKETREIFDGKKRETKERDNCKKKTDQGRKKENEKRKDKCEREVGKEIAEKRKESGKEKDKVRIKRVEVTSKKSILV